MKQKYILVTVDQILQEIKYLKIFFYNDFKTFLLNCSEESYLIYKTKYVNKTRQSIYNILKILNNLKLEITELKL